MKAYRIEFRPAALRQLGKLDGEASERVRKALILLSRDPRPPASRPLRVRDAYRLRVGPYRIVYRIEDDVLLVVVVSVGHRRDVYR